MPIVATMKIARMISFLFNPHYLRLLLAWNQSLQTPHAIAVFQRAKGYYFIYGQAKPLPDTLAPVFKFSGVYFKVLAAIFLKNTNHFQII